MLGAGPIRRVVLVAIVLLGVSLSAGCGEETVAPTSDAPDPIPATASNVGGHVFYSGPGTTSGIKLQRGTQVTIGFSGSRIRAEAGCGRIVGDFQFRHGRLVTSNLRDSAGMGATCEGRLAKQNDWLLEFLRKPAIARTFEGGGALVLDSRGDSMEMIESGDDLEPSRRLERSLWQMDSIERGQMKLRLPDDAAVPEMMFTDGVVAFWKACDLDEVPANWGQSSIEISNELEVDQECPQPRRIWVEAITNVLNGPVEYRFRGNSLVLDGVDRTLVLTPN